MGLQITEVLAELEWVILRTVMFIIFLYVMFELLDKHVPIKAAAKKLAQWITPSTKL